MQLHIFVCLLSVSDFVSQGEDDVKDVQYCTGQLWVFDKSWIER